jgi:hypothetical protein
MGNREKQINKTCTTATYYILSHFYLSKSYHLVVKLIPANAVLLDIPDKKHVKIIPFSD